MAILGGDLDEMRGREQLQKTNIVHWLHQPAAFDVMREWMAELGQRGIVAVGWLGKVKTTLQFLSIAILLFAQAGMQQLVLIFGELLLYIAGALTLWSMVLYLKGAWPALTER